MEQRQLRLGDTLDDYCPRERRLTNHAVVAMVGADVKQTRCTTCEAEHEYKQAKVPRQRRKADTPAALYAQVAAGAPKRSTPAPGRTTAIAVADDHEAPEVPRAAAPVREAEPPAPLMPAEVLRSLDVDDTESDEDDERRPDEEGPVHRPLIRASLPREGQPPPARPIPEFTIRQPAGRPGRFRPRGAGGHPRGQEFQGNRAGGGQGGQARAGGPRPGGRPPQAAMPSRSQRRNGPGRNRSK